MIEVWLLSFTFNVNLKKKSCEIFQSYYGEYYARYLEEYQKYGAQLAGGPEEESIEISILMGDLMNNGMNPSCAIM